jgi:hypothetical protein
VTTWDHEIARVAGDLTALVARAQRGVVDLDVAVTARAAVLDGAAAVLGDVVPRTRHESSTTRTRHVTLHQLERDPLGALGFVLRRRVRPELERSPSELLDASGPWNAATTAWASAGRHALLAARAWWRSPCRELSGEQAWEAVGTVAAIAEAIAVLDVDLADRNAGGRPEIDRILASGAGLRIAARETLSLARSGPDPGPVSAPEPAVRVVTPAEAMCPVARGGAAISSGLGRLTGMLKDADSLTPQHVRTCARLGRDLAVMTVRDGGPGAHREVLGDLARALHCVAHSDRGERAILPSSCRALEVQLLDLHQATRALLGRPAGAMDASEADRVQQRLPVLVAALSVTTEQQVAEGRWAVPARNEGDHFPFTMAARTGPCEPAILQPMRQATTAAEALSDRSTVISGDRIRAHLAQAALDRRLREFDFVQRPVHPARPTSTRPAPIAHTGPAL